MVFFFSIRSLSTLSNLLTLFLDSGGRWVVTGIGAGASVVGVGPCAGVVTGLGNVTGVSRSGLGIVTGVSSSGVGTVGVVGQQLSGTWFSL